MNIENMKKLSAHLRAIGDPAGEPEVGFNMETFWCSEARGEGYVDRSGHDCDTITCIGGHAAMLSHLECAFTVPQPKSVTAAEWLGLTSEEANELFFPPSEKFWTATPSQAADEVDKMIFGRMPWQS